MILDDVVAMVNQPDSDPWARKLYKDGCNNNWMPSEIPMDKDIKDWRSNDVLSPDERLVYTRCIGFFAGTESLVSNNLLINIGKHIVSGECRSYIARQMFEESLHNETILYICESLDLDKKTVFQAYNSIPSIKAKDDFLMKITSDLGRPDFTKSTLEGKKELLMNIIAFYVICEGILFYSGFVTLMAFGRQQKMPGTSEQMQYSMRDEALHLQFGVNLIQKIKDEYPEIWDDNFVQQVYNNIDTAMQLEVAYARDILPNGILGLNSDMLMEYVQFICNRRLKSIGLEEKYPNAKNPFSWLSETNDLRKQKNFFETRVNEYKKGGGVKNDF